MSMNKPLELSYLVGREIISILIVCAIAVLNLLSFAAQSVSHSTCF